MIFRYATAAVWIEGNETFVRVNPMNIEANNFDEADGVAMRAHQKLYPQATHRSLVRDTNGFVITRDNIDTISLSK